MRDWYARALWAVFAAAAIGCEEEGKVDGDAGGSSDGGGSAGDDDAGQAPASPCTRTADCDDGMFCNGAETCVDLLCQAGEAPACDDGIACTVDRCVEERRECVSSAPDGDGDGHLDVTCQNEDGDALGDDCDDDDSTRYPGANEICDADDHDEDCDLSTFGRVDFDGDGFDNANCCNVQDDETLVCGDDCDDADSRAHPFNTETCDGLDNDCNGELDHPTEDQDGDGHATTACGGTDCDDFNPVTYAGAMELCDGFDNDCIQGGGVADDETDLDADDFVSAVCEPMPPLVLAPGDCNDGQPAANPMRDEACNGRDDDCDEMVDEGGLDCSHAIKQVDADHMLTCATRVNGTVACWGWNSDDRLATGVTDWWIDQPTDVLDDLNPPKLSGVRAVSVSQYHACAVLDGGGVSCWGYNAGSGLLGQGSDQYEQLRPTPVPNLTDVAEICTAVNFTVARKTNGELWWWGDNYADPTYGDDYTSTLATSPTRIEDLNAIDVDCNGWFACAALVDGSVWCWGDNATGQLGDITTNFHHEPTVVYNVQDAIGVATSRSHACALLRDGGVKCWGDNSYGQVGVNMTSTMELRASQVLLFTGEPLTDVTELVAGGGPDHGDSLLEAFGNGFTCARLRSGPVHCWGRNEVGELGVGAWGDTEVEPTLLDGARGAVQELPNALQVSVGYQHACAVAFDGQLYCWGGGNGQMPGDTVYSSTSAVLIDGF